MAYKKILTNTRYKYSQIIINSNRNGLSTQYKLVYAQYFYSMNMAKIYMRELKNTKPTSKTNILFIH